jgi:hypothetical protein
MLLWHLLCIYFLVVMLRPRDILPQVCSGKVFERKKVKLVIATFIVFEFPRVHLSILLG